MRNVFIKNLEKKTTKNTFLIIADLGYGVIENFKKKFSNQFINAGIAEQNMTGMAAGLALEGFKVLTYSIGNFNNMRCLEQIRNDICYHNLDVTVVSVGPGFAYGAQGYSHHSVQDIAVLGSLPNMSLLLPGDALEVEYVINYIFKNRGPKYIRLGKAPEKSFHKKLGEIKKINCFNKKVKSDLALISTSSMLEIAFDVKNQLAKRGVNINLFSCPIIDGEFKTLVKKELNNFQWIFTLEEHIKELGFGSLIRNAFDGEAKKIKSFGTKKDTCKIIGDRGYLCECHDISPNKISESIIKIVEKNEKK